MVTLRIQCVVCLTPFEAVLPTRMYCSPRCKMRAHRSGMAAVKARAESRAITDSPVSPSAAPGGVEAATTAVLASAGVTGTPVGQAALALARRIDAGVDAGSAMAAMVREHRTALTAALADGRVEVNPLDELRARRERAAG